MHTRSSTSSYVQRCKSSSVPFIAALYTERVQGETHLKLILHHFLKELAWLLSLNKTILAEYHDNISTHQFALFLFLYIYIT